MGCPLCRNVLLPSRWHLQLILHGQLNRHHFYEAFFRHLYPSQSKSNFYALKGPLARDTSHLISPMGTDLALGTETISLPEKKPAQRKQSQETETEYHRKNSNRWIQPCLEVTLCLALEAGLCFLVAFRRLLPLVTKRIPNTENGTRVGC